MTLHENNKKKQKQRWWAGVFSCFRHTTVYDSDGDDKVFVRKPLCKIKRLILSRLPRKKRTVPIEISGNATDRLLLDCDQPISRRTSHANKESNSSRQGEAVECFEEFRTQKQPRSILASKSASEAVTVPVPVHGMMASGNDYLISKSAPLCRTLDLVQAQSTLQTSNCNSPQSSHYSTPDSSSPRVVDADNEPTRQTDSSKLVPMLTVAAALVLLFGRGFAVFSMCVYFYIVSRFKSESAENKDQMKKGHEDIDHMNSAMHKKMVVLRGFLERGKKKPATNFRSSSS